MSRKQAKAVTNLRDWLLKQEKSSFPGPQRRDYCAQFRNAEAHFFKEVHPEVEKLAMKIDGGYLTDHGPLHIRTVIDRASRMIAKAGLLTPYEVYILLLAIHLHDVGNVFGREGHEKKLGKVIACLGKLLGDESVEIRMIRQIAEAHGGKAPDGRTIDTIGALPIADPFLGEDVRLQLLAAILRFADELADDSDRASRLALQLEELPPEAEVYHQYAKALHSVKVWLDSRSVQLTFNLNAETACKIFAKNGGPHYLLDEIYGRTVKMHSERIYCSRFMWDVVRLEIINVEIRVFRDPSDISPFARIEYSLRESGYPHGPQRISELVPNLDWTGEKLRQRLLDEKGQAADGH